MKSATHKPPYMNRANLTGNILQIVFNVSILKCCKCFTYCSLFMLTHIYKLISPLKDKISWSTITFTNSCTGSYRLRVVHVLEDFYLLTFKYCIFVESSFELCCLISRIFRNRSQRHCAV